MRLRKDPHPRLRIDEPRVVAFAGFEGRRILLPELWLIDLWTAFAESAVIESPALPATSKAKTKSYSFSGRRWQSSIRWTLCFAPRERFITLVILPLPSRRLQTCCHEYATVLVYSQAVAFWSQARADLGRVVGRFSLDRHVTRYISIVAEG
jgi:hypothetical protein